MQPFRARASLVLAALLSFPGCGEEGGAPDAGSCIPRTCEAFGRECGPLADGCGGTLECGTCQAPLTCNARGICDEDVCIPTTCAELGKDCGRVPDGCGRTVLCGECSGSEICAVAEPNVCALPPDPCSDGAWTGYGDAFFDRTCRGCHAQFDRYDNVRRNTRIRREVSSGRMPKGSSLTAAEKQWLLDWIDCGMKQ